MAASKQAAPKPKARGPVATSVRSAAARVEVRTPNVAGYSHRVDAAKYAAMKKVVLAVLPGRAPGLTMEQMLSAIRVRSAGIFPGNTAMWWAKCVQLDLEARGILTRETSKPMRWHRTQRSY